MVARLLPRSPLFTLLRVHFKEDPIKNCALGLENLSEIISEDSLLEASQHFPHFLKPTPAPPAVMVHVNHKTYIKKNIVLYIRENNIMMLTFQPRCSHSLQTFDNCPQPFKARCRTTMNDQMTGNAGKTVTIHNVGQFSKEAF